MVSNNGGRSAHGAAVLESVSPADVVQSARDHVWIHNTSWVDVAADEGLHVFDRGEGCFLYDVQGREYIDGISGLWVVNAGHGRKEIGAAMGRCRSTRPISTIRLGDSTTGVGRRTSTRSA